MPGDSYGTLWSFWWNMAHPIDWIAPAQPTLLAMAKILTLLFNEVAAYNFLILASYPLAGLAIYLIVHHFTQDRAASWLAGFIYILGPYHIYQSYVHLSLAMIAWLPFYLYALLLWLKDPQPWRAVVSGLLLAMVILDNYYYGYLAILLTVFFVVGLLVQIWRRKLSFWVALGQGVVAATIAILIVVPFILPSFDSQTVTQFERPVREVFVFRAQWWDFFVPPITHPAVGNLVRETTSYELAGSNYFERTLYLGYMPLFLAILGVWRNRRSWLTYLMVALFLASLIIATAPADIAVWLHDLFPAFRVYSRFGVLSLVAVSILAGLGIASISKGTRSFLLHIAFGIFVLTDFYPLLPSPMFNVATPRPVETVLAQQPTGMTIVYPLATLDELRTNEYLGDSRRFGQSMFNAIHPSHHDERIQEILMNPLDPAAIPMMQRFGIRYLLVRKDVYLEGRLPEKLQPYYDPDYPRYLPAWNNGQVPDLGGNPDLSLIYEDSEAALYEVSERERLSFTGKDLAFKKARLTGEKRTARSYKACLIDSETRPRSGSMATTFTLTV